MRRLHRDTAARRPAPGAPEPAGRAGRAGRARRVGPVALLTVLGLLALAPAASADDLLILNGDSVTLSGNQNYGLVYIDGSLQLTGDTSITANSIYIGPDAYLDTCYVPGPGDGACTAGRSLNLSSSGPLTVATDINLTAGTGPVRPGGNLTLTGSPVVVSGGVTTAGSHGGTSGSVTVNSNGSLAIGSIYSPGAPVSLHGSGAIDVDGTIDTEGTTGIPAPSPSQAQSAAPITVASSGGDVRIDGSLNAYGQDGSGPGPLAGGNGAPVTVSGANVRTGQIDSTGGSGFKAPAGTSGQIKVSASGSLTVLGGVNASGQNSTTGPGTAGQPITLAATGPLTVAGRIDSSGGQSNIGGWPGGSITLTGATATAGTLDVSGADASTAGSAGAGGAITVNAPGGASFDSLNASGGNGNTGAAGAGGSISVTSATGSIAVGNATTKGGTDGNGSGANGGPMTLSAGDNLTVGALTADGGPGGSANPPPAGGNGGNVTLRAATGTLSLEGNASAAGGTGGSFGGPGPGLGGQGGNGGQIEVIAHAIGPVASLSSAGGDGGNGGTCCSSQGPGGHGGAIFGWTNGPLFDDQQLVTSDGGNGNPTGIGGAKHQDAAPTGLSIQPSTGLLSFTSQSPDASGYEVMRSEPGSAPAMVLRTTVTSDLRPRAPLCVPVSFTVVAVNDAEQWTSDPSNAVSYVRQPSSKQRCSDAPRLTALGKRGASWARLRRAGWIVTIVARSSGIGSLRVLPPVSLTRGRHHKGPALGLMQISRAGRLKLRLLIPPSDRRPGIFRVRVRTISPNGKGHAINRLRLKISS
jgi:hypothetical protein